MVEIAQRYRSEPFNAVLNRWGVLFCLFNGALSTGGFLLLYTLFKGAGPMPALQALQLAAVGGFGAPIVMRAKILTARLPGGQQFAVGPDFVVETFLDVIDRKLDQLRAKVRYDTVHELMKDIDFQKAKLKLTAQLYLAMQNVDENEIADLRCCIDELESTSDSEMDPQEKSYNLGYYLLDLVGRDFLTHVMTEYREELRVNGPPPLES